MRIFYSKALIVTHAGCIREILHYNQMEIERLSDIEKSWVKRFDLPAVVEKFKNLF